MIFRENYVFTETVRTGEAENYQDWINHRKLKGKMPSHIIKEEVFEDREDGEGNAETESETDGCAETETGIKAENTDNSALNYSVTVDDDESETGIKAENTDDTALNYSETVDNEGSETGPKDETEQLEIYGPPGTFILSDINNNNVETEGTEEPVPKRRKTVTKYAFCPIDGFNFLDPNQTVMNAHLSKDHEGYTFDCRHCSKKFSTHSARYKHKKDHNAYSMFCGDCGKGFHFESELNRHVGVHNTVLPFTCTQCEKRYAAKKTLDRHVKEHLDVTFTCDQCDKTAPTQEKMYSHYRGAHGTGYEAPCGNWSQWSGKRARHQKNCDKCKELLQLKIRRQVPFKLTQDFKTEVKSVVKIKTETKPKIKTEVKVEIPKKLKTETVTKKELKVVLERTELKRTKEEQRSQD